MVIVQNLSKFGHYLNKNARQLHQNAGNCAKTPGNQPGKTRKSTATVQILVKIKRSLPCNRLNWNDLGGARK